MYIVNFTDYDAPTPMVDTIWFWWNNVHGSPNSFWEIWRYNNSCSF